MTEDAPALFDERRRMVRRDRACAGDSWFDTLVTERLVERIDDVNRRFANALVIGARQPALVTALRQRCDRVDIVEPATLCAARAGTAPQSDERLDVEPESYDLVVWPLGLESLSDVPGALLRCRFALRPDGLLTGALFGDGSFPLLRRAMQAADRPAAVARMHPQLPLAAVGDLLQRCGLALVVSDVERLVLGYSSLDRLVADLRHAALTNMLAGPVRPLTRQGVARARAMFDSEAGQETARLILFSGWAPDASQPQPARRGSANASLARLLERGGKRGDEGDVGGGHG